jgi:acyl-coenzyme A synthetase/AMP-(fatty) acid ligase
LNQENATSDSFYIDKDGQKWFKTADIAIKSSKHDGAFRMLGRMSQDIIKKMGYKISALELEHTLGDHELVYECAVLGVPDKDFGEEIVACIVLNPDAKVDHATAEKLISAHMR